MSETPAEATAKPAKSVGALNGKYAFLFKLNMILIPIFCAKLLAWGTWVSYHQVLDNDFRTKGDRYTAAMAQRDQATLETKLKEWARSIFAPRT